MKNTFKVRKNIYCVDVGAPEIPKTFASYILIEDTVMIIDPGPSRYYKNLLEAIDTLGIHKENKILIALTHIHPDHAGGSSKIINVLPKAKILVHPIGKKHLVNPEILWKSTREVLGSLADLIGKPDAIPENRIMEVRDNSIFQLSEELRMLAIYTPGHASHHISYFTDSDNIIFAGDSAGLFIDESLAPTTPPPFKFDVALASLRKMMRLKPEYIAYSHFGYTNKGIQQLLLYYGQLSLWYNLVSQFLKEKYANDKLMELLLETDQLAKNFVAKTTQNPFLSDALKRSLEGFISYIKSKKT